MTTKLRTTGFTLIELLLYVSMLSTLLLGAVGFFATMSDARVKNQAVSEVDQQGTAAMQYITQTIRSATTISSPAAGASAATTSLVVPTSGNSPTVFALSSGALTTTLGANSAVALTGGKVQVTSLTFTNLSRSGTPGVLRVAMTIKRINPNNRAVFEYEKTFTTSVALRKSP